MATRFPLFIIRSERIYGPECLSGVWEYLAWSANVMFTGMYPTSGFRGQPGPMLGRQGAPGCPMYGGRKLRLCELRGDWEHHAQIFKLKHFYASNDICHICRASKVNPSVPYTDFRKQPAWRNTERTHREFLLEEVGDPINSLVYVAGFHYRMLRMDSMHTINLGCGLFANGGAMYEMLKVNHFGAGDKAAVFRTAFRCFKAFTKAQGIECSQPVFKPWFLVSRGQGEEFCYFASKVPRKNIINFLMFYCIQFSNVNCFLVYMHLGSSGIQFASSDKLVRA